MAWGWSPDRILIIDEDLGHSGSSAEGRAGFQRVLAEVTLDHVGLILGIEMSRLARCCRDWHQLLEVCALFDVIFADADGVYDPRDYNDRLLLGLKGTLSEAELHLLRQRMNQGRLNKARRGELFSHPPTGYVRLACGELAIDPDQQVQGILHLIFQTFARLGTLNATLRYLVKNQISLPIRCIGGADHGLLQWRRPNRQTLRNILRHPIYAGVYTWGRRAVDPRRKKPGRPATGRTVVEPEQCQVFLPDRCPAYITWEQYRANQKRLADNRYRSEAQGAAREGPSLLGGLLVCGTCGQRMMVQYSGRANRLRYACLRHHIEYGSPLCQGICGQAIDTLIQRLVLTVLEPAALELSLAAEEDQQAQRQRLQQHWQQRLERAGYEADRAARAYRAVEPENRLVGRELEKRWEQTLAEQRQVQEACDRFLAEQPVALSDADRQVVRALASDIPALWHVQTTTAAERKTIVRHLIQKVVLTAPTDQETAEVQVHWSGGFISHHELVRPVARYEQLQDYPGLCRRIVELRQQKLTSVQIAQELNAEGWHPPKRRATFNANMVRQIFYRRGLARTQPASSYTLQPGEWWPTDLARELQLPQSTLYRWMYRGWINARKIDVDRGRWVLWADAEELDRLARLRTCPRTWDNQPQAAALAKPKPWPGQSEKL